MAAFFKMNSISIFYTEDIQTFRYIHVNSLFKKEIVKLHDFFIQLYFTAFSIIHAYKNCLSFLPVPKSRSQT